MLTSTSGWARLRAACTALGLASGGVAMAAGAAPAAIGLLAADPPRRTGGGQGAIRDNCELEKTLQNDLLAALRARGRSIDAVTSRRRGGGSGDPACRCRRLAVGRTQVAVGHGASARGLRALPPRTARFPVFPGDASSPDNE
jgi:hypothetical protein